MLPPCFALADRVFPLVRQRAAVLMAADGRSQSEIAARLGVSQAMVSKYLRGGSPEPGPHEAWIVEEMASEVATASLGPVAGTPEAGAANPWCRTFAQTLGPGDEARMRVVADLALVLRSLEELPLAPLVPEVNINVAGALADADQRGDVAAFPGRLGFVRGRLRAHAPPEFGASEHLSAVLLAARRQRDAIAFVVNLRASEGIRRALAGAGERVVEADGKRRDDRGVPAFRLGAEDGAVWDAGGFGIEPALYLFDVSAAGLAERVAALVRAVQPH